ncbi:MAG: hypothetical protein Q8K18_16105 [Burkholderiales bacterium]|nr:hypothetical protein [Burkholderiales bacterium]
MHPDSTDRPDYGTGASQVWIVLRWLLVAVLALILTYVSFRGYLSPELLFGFANSFTC